MKKTIVILSLLLIVSLLFNYIQFMDARDQQRDEKVEVKKETKVETKEEKHVSPEPVISEVTEKISVKKPVFTQNLEETYGNDAKSDSIPEISPEELITETDSTYEIPITQKVYSDSSYTAYISGYHARLDSIFVRHQIINNNITKTITKKKRWTFGLQAGVYATPKGIQPGIGIGASCNIW